MKSYPKIPGPKDAPMEQCIAFNKYDGSNLRFEWSKKRGFHKFGTRRRMFDRTDPDFGSAIDIFLNSHAEALEKVFTDNKNYFHSEKNAVNIAFAEFVGPNSFAGLHKPDEIKELILFDVWVYKTGFINPWDFLKDFSQITKCAEKVYEGRFTGKLTSDVREGKYNVKEGVVCKGGKNSKDVWMCKIKTYAYLEKLKSFYGHKYIDYWE